MYPTHYVGDEGYISDTEDTLSHEGEKVDHFRKKKLEEKEEEKEKKKLQQQKNKNKELERLNLETGNTDIAQSPHSEL